MFLDLRMEALIVTINQDLPPGFTESEASQPENVVGKTEKRTNP